MCLLSGILYDAHFSESFAKSQPQSYGYALSIWLVFDEMIYRDSRNRFLEVPLNHLCAVRSNIKIVWFTFHPSMLADKELLELFSVPSSREKAFSLLLHQFQKGIYYYIRRMVLDHDDADDITQNTFIKAWRGLDTFRGESKISTWLHTIAYRESITFLASKKRLGKVYIENVEHALPATLQQDKYYSGDDIQRLLQVALATLPQKQKAVFIMKYYEEKKYEEIAEITGTSVGALKASFHHAVQKIEAHLEKNIR